MQLSVVVFVRFTGGILRKIHGANTCVISNMYHSCSVTVKFFVWEGYEYTYTSLTQYFGKSAIARYIDGVKI
jgi:hypothetical protein